MFRVLLLVVALIAGGSAAWLALAVRGTPSVTMAVQPAPEAPTQDVLVASGDVAQGQTLTKDNIRWQRWPESALNPAFIKRSAQPDALETLTGSIVRSRIVSGEPIGMDKLASKNSGFLAAMLPSGKRAVGVRITAENTAGGFILPNDRVDVLHTTQAEGQKEHVSRAILRNITVLAIDQTVDENSKDDKGKAKSAVIGKTATLELGSAQADILTAAQAKGTISLALRSVADRDEPARIDAPPASRTVRIVRGGRSEVVHIENAVPAPNGLTN